MQIRWLVLCCFASSALADKAPPPPPPPPPSSTIPKGAVTISSKVLESLRTKGSSRIEPQPGVLAAMRSDGATKVTGDVKICLSTVGGVVHSEITKSTGYPTFDLRITSEVVDWMFQPYKVNAKSVPACGTITITYTVDTTKAIDPKLTDGKCLLGDGSATRLELLRTDVDMICGAAKATNGKDFMSVGPYIAERMKTDLLAELFARLRTTTTLDMIVGCVRSAMAKTAVKTCATVDVLLANRPR